MEFLAFLELIERATPRRRDIHKILGNCETHTHAQAQAWFAFHPRNHFHFTLTSALWLNTVERWFAEITRKRFRRGTFHSFNELNRAVSDYVWENNPNPSPFNWTATATSIVKKIKHYKEALDAQY